ncbi:titin-like [Ditylenchus destructor]|uniref:Titin-like n=1 Tax=Ditylenchus destructor TaxID=166010 RepID=A0AAD4MY00_9BILA|nr:titin-like [Ditylenchus destructor]
MVENGSKVVKNRTKVVEIQTKMVENRTKVVENGSKMVENRTKVVENGSKMVENRTKMLENPESENLDHSLSSLSRCPPPKIYRTDKTVISRTCVLSTPECCFWEPKEQKQSEPLRGNCYDEPDRWPKMLEILRRDKKAGFGKEVESGGENGRESNKNARESNKKVENQVKMVENQTKMVENQVKMVENQVKMVENQVKMVENQVKMVENQVKMVENQVKMVENHVKMVENQVKMVENQNFGKIFQKMLSKYRFTQVSAIFEQYRKVNGVRSNDPIASNIHIHNLFKSLAIPNSKSGGQE